MEIEILGAKSLSELIELWGKCSFSGIEVMICRKMFGKTEAQIKGLLPDKAHRETADNILKNSGEFAKQDLSLSITIDGNPVGPYDPSVEY